MIQVEARKGGKKEEEDKKDRRKKKRKNGVKRGREKMTVGRKERRENG